MPLSNPSAIISNDAYNATNWNGVTDVAPSKDAVRDQVETMNTSISGKEPSLGNPVSDGMVLSSTAAGVRSWITSGSSSQGSAMVTNWSTDVTKTNVGTSYVDVFSASTFVNGNRTPVGFSGYTQYRCLCNYNKVGSGTQSIRAVDQTNITNVLHEFNDAAAAEEKELDSGWQNLPGWATGDQWLKLQIKSTTATDDPVFRRFIILLK